MGATVQARYMSTGQLERFESALRDHEGHLVRTDTDGFGAALRDIVVTPAVGVRLGIKGVSLDDHGVTLEPTVRELSEARTGVTAVASGVADYGSVIVEATPAGTEPLSLFVDRHVAVIRESDIVPDMTRLFEALGPAIREDRSSQVIATGPSATADMGALVYGAHGPREVYVVCLTNR